MKLIEPYPKPIQRQQERYYLTRDNTVSEDVEREVNRKAAICMKNNNFSYKAVGYAFKSQDMTLAVSMVEGTVIEAFQDAKLDSLVKWMDMLPEDMVKKSEVLSVRKAIACFITGLSDEAIKHMNSLGKEFE